MNKTNELRNELNSYVKERGLTLSSLYKFFIDNPQILDSIITEDIPDDYKMKSYLISKKKFRY